MSSNFVHLHVHTEYSVLDGACRVKDLLNTVKAQEMPAVAITDHGNMFGVIDFYQKADSIGVKPIIGFEAYTAPVSRFDKKAKQGEETSYHLTLLAKNNIGYKNLMKLTSIGYMEGFYYKPRIDLESLFQHKEGLIVLSGCMTSEFSGYLLRNKDEEAEKYLDKMIQEFGKDDFYIELQRNGIPEQEIIYKKSIELAEKKGLKLVATSDVHYLTKEDSFAHEVMLCIQTSKTLEDEKRMKFSTQEFYFKTAEEMEKLFSEVPSAISNTLEIAEKCNVKIDFSQRHLPKFNVPDNKDLDEYLKDLCDKSLVEKYPDAKEAEKQRLEFELKTIKDMGFSSYFLIVSDFIQYAKKEGIPVGPGRGSAAGSIVSYLLDITTLDPLKYDLLFERFLNPARITMPDIDIDFCKDGRAKVIDYVTQKYGRENVAQIITFGTMAARMVVRDVGRVLNIPLVEVDMLAKHIPPTPKVSLKASIEEVPELRKYYEENTTYKRLFDIALKLEGMTRQTGIHAAGIVISEGALTEHTPLNKSGTDITTQYEGGCLEDIGLLKMDFLGLKTLTVIKGACDIIKQVKEIDIDINNIPLDDKKTYELLNEGKTVGVFQLESDGMRNLAKNMGVDSFEVILALLALYRPGPLDWAPDFVERKHGNMEITYEHPLMEGILKETYGIMLYQEQVMQVVNQLAGFTLAEADLLRRAMGKKKHDVMEAQRQKFIEGAAKHNNIQNRLADKIFDNIFKFAGYGFNKSHSAAYAMISYQTAYLKANYPVCYMCSLLSSEVDNSDKIVKYMEECKEMEIETFFPDVNESFSKFTVVGNGIRFGLSAIKNIGEGAIESIVNARTEKGKFTSIYNFCEHIEAGVVNKRAIESLIKSGSFDSFNVSRSKLLACMDNALNASQNIQKDLAKGQSSLFDVFEKQEEFVKTVEEYPDVPEWTEHQKLAYEKEIVGFYITGHPLSEYEEILRLYTTEKSSTLSKYIEEEPSEEDKKFNFRKEGKTFTIGGLITSVKVIVTRKGDNMAFIRLEDLEGVCEVIAFPEAYDKYRELIKVDNPVFIEGSVSKNQRNDNISVISKKIMHLKDIENMFATAVRVKIGHNVITDNLDKLNLIIKKHHGDCNLKFDIHLSEKNIIEIEAGSDFAVNPSIELKKEIEDLLGKETMILETSI
jgi:DNA polymerase III subunit alpha